jgi:hypothetical protein
MALQRSELGGMYGPPPDRKGKIEGSRKPASMYPSVGGHQSVNLRFQPDRDRNSLHLSARSVTLLGKTCYFTMR